MSREITGFLISFLSGAIMRLSYQILSEARVFFHVGRKVTEITDLLFWIMSALFWSMRIYRANDGMIRWFFVTGTVLGALGMNVLIHRAKRKEKK